MKTSISTFILLCLCLMFNLNMTISPGEEDTMELLKSAYNKMTENYTPKKGEQVHFIYEVTTEGKFADKSSSTKVVFESYGEGDHRLLLSDDTEIYQDKKSTVAIMHDQQLIYLMDAFSGEQIDTRNNKFSMMQEEMFKYLTNINQSSEKKVGKDLVMISAEVSQEGRTKLNAVKFEFWIDPQNGELAQCKAWHVPGSPAISTLCTFSLNEKGVDKWDVLKQDAIKLYLDKLKNDPRLKSYEVSDMRS